MQDNNKDERTENTFCPEKPKFLNIVFENAGCGTYGTIIALIVCLLLCFVSEAFIYFSILLGAWTLFWLILHILDYHSQMKLYKEHCSEFNNSSETAPKPASKKLILVLVIAAVVLFVCWVIHSANQYYDSLVQSESSNSQISIVESDTTTTTKPETFTHTYSATTKRATTYSYEPTPVSQRCWYCGKVIFSDGRAIHATHKYSDTYECGYCGKPNVKE